jgi:hypothetical protein
MSPTNVGGHIDARRRILRIDHNGPALPLEEPPQAFGDLGRTDGG